MSSTSKRIELHALNRITENRNENRSLGGQFFGKGSGRLERSAFEPPWWCAGLVGIHDLWTDFTGRRVCAVLLV